MSCSCGPCNTSITNTAACESLPSQIQNFIDAFFGAVIKTEVDGQVVWTLPCNLDIGLPNNARAEGEGLACYFLRLFSEGIIGLTGPQGDEGDAGTNGNNAYTVTLQGFAQPTSAAPNITVLTNFNPAIVPGLYVFIETSGHYFVTGTDPSGLVFLTLVRAADAAPVVINAGRLVIPSGTPGATGATGASVAGPAGPAGSNATGFSVDNEFYFATVGTDYPLTIAYTAVDFVNSSPAVNLPAVGRYNVTVIAELIGTAGVLTSDIATLKLRNTTVPLDIEGSEHRVNFVQDTEIRTIVINVPVVTTAANQQIALFGKATTATKFSVVALKTTLQYFRMA